MTRWVIVVLALVAAGWLAFDGAHALLTGDYVTPASGPHAGRLGPWSSVFEAIGVDPRSLTVKWLHVVVGAAWLAAIPAFAFRAHRSWGAMLLCAIAGVWYLPFGTIISLLVGGLLFLPAVKRQYHVGERGLWEGTSRESADVK